MMIPLKLQINSKVRVFSIGTDIKLKKNTELEGEVKGYRYININNVITIDYFVEGNGFSCWCSAFQIIEDEIPLAKTVIIKRIRDEIDNETIKEFIKDNKSLFNLKKKTLIEFYNLQTNKDLLND